MTERTTIRRCIPRAGLTLSLAATLVCGRGPDTGLRSTGAAELPTLNELDEGWNTLEPGGETTCALGGDYRFFARAGDPRRLVVYFDGGGACWDGEGCDPEADPTYSYEIDAQADLGRRHGIFDLGRPDNPLADRSLVVVPYCTGDVHLGDRDATYTVEGEDGEAHSITVHHRGQVNAGAVLAWIDANFDSPSEIFVSGTSAGGVATPFYAALLAGRHPEASVIGLGDAAGAYTGEAMAGAEMQRWGVPDVLRRHPGWEGVTDTLGIAGLYVTAARAAPGLRLFQVDHARDAVQRFFLERAGADSPHVAALLRANRQVIRGRVEDFRAYTIGGFRHGAMPHPLFYRYRADGRALRDWVAAIAAGEPVASVACTDCSRPGFLYTDTDLRIVERARELLTSPGAWDPRDEAAPCGPRDDPDRYSLRCALVQAVRDVAGRSSAEGEPAFWDVVHTAAERSDRPRPDALLRYNNSPDRTVGEVIGLLEEVEVRIGTRLERQAVAGAGAATRP